MSVESPSSFSSAEVSDDENDDGDSTDIQGSEDFEAKVTLVATTNAPAGATGCAKIESEDDDGAMTANFELKLIGLNPGNYILSVVKASDGSTVVLGQITLSADDEDGND